MGVTSEAELVRFGARRYFELEEAIAPMRFKDFGVNIMVAIGSREAACMQLLNEARTDKGMFQITMRYHAATLVTLPGCPAATFGDPLGWERSWKPEPGKTAADDGYVPTLRDGVRFSYRLLKGAYEYGRDVKEITSAGKLIRFTLAAYNAGIGGASRGYREGNVDKYTTGGDYSKNVLERWHAVSDLTKKLGWH